VLRLRRAIGLLVFASILGTAGVARSQPIQQAQVAPDQMLRDGIDVDPARIAPTRELVLPLKRLEAFAGVSASFDSKDPLKPFVLPLGAGVGLVDHLEVGAEIDVALNQPLPPFAASVGVHEPRLYGRYEILPQMLGAELSLFVPVFKDGDRFGFRIDAPARLKILPELILLAGLSVGVYLPGTLNAPGLPPAGVHFDEVNFLQLGATAIYQVIDRVWAGFEFGFSTRNLSTSDLNLWIPIGINAGYELVPGIALLGGFRFYDIKHPDSRTAQLLLVYTSDLGGT
jgi:hypothetical protein